MVELDDQLKEIELSDAIKAFSIGEAKVEDNILAEVLPENTDALLPQTREKPQYHWTWSCDIKKQSRQEQLQ